MEYTYSLVIFDLDGTLLDTLEDLTNSVNFALQRSDYPLCTQTQVRSFVGDGMGKLIERALPSGTSKKTFARVYADFCKHYSEHCTDNTKPYKGINSALEAMKSSGLTVAVVSNKADFAVRHLCSKHFNGLVDFVFGERKGIRRKPAPDSVLEVLFLTKTSVDRAVYIGDSDIDIFTARNAGVRCISVDWGFRDRTDLKKAGADNVVSTPMDLVPLVLF